jgi:hypothetical protein
MKTPLRILLVAATWVAISTTVATANPEDPYRQYPERPHRWEVYREPHRWEGYGEHPYRWEAYREPPYRWEEYREGRIS